MRMLFFLAHPAHYHLLKHVIRGFLDDGTQVTVVIVKKDVLEALVSGEPWDVVNLAPEGRRMDGLPFALAGPLLLWRTERRLLPLVRRLRPDVMVGTELTLAHVGRLCGIPTVILNEDDTAATPENYLFYPFATALLLPSCCDPGRWEGRRVSYPGYHELAYLHPELFTPDPRVAEELSPDERPYFLLRLVSLTASHDAGKRGIDNGLAQELTDYLSGHGRVYITAERPLPPAFEPLRIRIDPKRIHHALAGARLVVGDSQTMAAEAMVLGTASVRINDFVGRLNYLRELEEDFGLGTGLRPHDSGRLLDTVRGLVEQSSASESMAERRRRMLSARINPVPLYRRLIALAAQGRRAADLRRAASEMITSEKQAAVRE